MDKGVGYVRVHESVFTFVCAGVRVLVEVDVRMCALVYARPCFTSSPAQPSAPPRTLAWCKTQ